MRRNRVPEPEITGSGLANPLRYGQGSGEIESLAVTPDWPLFNPPWWSDFVDVRTTAQTQGNCPQIDLVGLAGKCQCRWNKRNSPELNPKRRGMAPNRLKMVTPTVLFRP